MVRDLITAALGMIWLAILVLIGARFVSLYAGTDTDSSLADALYHRSDFLLRPLFDHLGLANQTLIATSGSVETASLLAFAVYFVAGWLVIGIVRNGIFGGSNASYAY